jgi:hypothetical protein
VFFALSTIGVPNAATNQVFPFNCSYISGSSRQTFSNLAMKSAREQSPFSMIASVQIQ